MTIWAIKAPPSNELSAEKYLQLSTFLTRSVKEGVSRFGWGSIDGADLNKLKSKQFADMSNEEKFCWKKANFLSEIAVGDWVVHVNLPYWGACLAAQVTKTYTFEECNNEVLDFRHMIGIDPSSVLEFNRNDERILPIISSRLKLFPRFWRISYVGDFLKSIANLKSNDFHKEKDESVGIFHLKKDLSPFLKSLTELIQKNHPAHHLESLLATVFLQIPGVIDVRENGKLKGWGTDYGADLIVSYRTGLAIGTLEKEEKLVVQVKSYIGQHSETNAIAQIGNAIREYDANAGMLITTGESTENLEKAIEELTSQLSKSEANGGLNRDVPISLIAGEDVAKLLLKYGGDLVL